MKSDYKIEVIRGISEKGIFDKNSWMSEADNHLLSSELLNVCSRSSRKKLNAFTAAKKNFGEKNDTTKIFSFIKEVEASSKSSLLLLGYSIELYIKAGLIRLHQNTTREDFDELLKKKYGHNLKKSSKLLGLDLSGDEENALDRIKELILNEARYPVTPQSSEEYCTQVNQVNSEVWSKTIYLEWVELAKKIKTHVQSIDSDSENPSVFLRYRIDDDGYCAFRSGGNLPTYLLVHYSTTQIKAKTNTEEALLNLLIDYSPDSICKCIIEKHKAEITVIVLKNKKA